MLVLKNVYKKYHSKKSGDTVAIDDISLTLPDSGMVFITGKSGSGKSSLLNVIGGLDDIDSGTISLNGKILKNINSKYMDFYRNTYLGFIFQDFNLIDDYTVYQNIELACSMQKKKISKEELNLVLNKMGLSGYGKRKMNELSGGERQRVAIARAIIKNPQIVLADEPTGNLDSATSKQILDLLKEISRERLVVIVSHDTDSAFTYADRIIKIEDGKVVQDIDNILDSNQNEEQKEVKFIKSKLSLINTLKLSFSNLKTKKLRLTISIVLITFSFLIFLIAFTLSKFDVPKALAETLIKEKVSEIEIVKRDKNYGVIHPATSFWKKDIEEIEKKTDSKKTEIVRIIEENDILQISFGPFHEAKVEVSQAYYNFNSISNNFKIINSWEDIKLIGNIPTRENEIVISKLLADYIMGFGISIREQDKNGKEIIKNFYPNSYQEIIDSKSKIEFGSTHLIITGILDEDLSEYESLKSIDSNDMLVNPSSIYIKMKQTYIDSGRLGLFLVNENFFDLTKFKPNTSICFDLYKMDYKIGNRKIYSDSTAVILKDEISYFDGTSIVKKKSLEQNQVIMNTSYLNKISDGKYNKELTDYIDSKMKEYEKLVTEREEKIKEEEQKSLLDETYIAKDIPEIKQPVRKDLINEYTISYIKENKIIGSKIEIEVNDLFLLASNNKTTSYPNMEIVGISLDGYYEYFSEEILSPYMRDNVEIVSLYLQEENIDKMISILENFELNKGKYRVNTIYNDAFTEITDDLLKISSIAKKISYVFLTFSLILFANLASISLKTNKKKIGILRSIGARKIEVIRIFVMESFLIGIFAFILSIIGMYLFVETGNIYLTKSYGFYIAPILFNIKILPYLFGIILITIFLCSIIPLFKISRMKPIDAILDK